MAPFTAYDKTVIYDSFDLSGQVKIGRNCIGVHLGNGFYNNQCDGWGFSGAVWRDVPKVIANLKIQYADGSWKQVVSDTSWKAAEGPVIYNQMREGEIFDGRRIYQGFDTVGFDDAAWQPALICRGAGGKFRPMAMPPERVIRTVKGRKIGEGIYDFGENMSGWVCILVKGRRGSRVCMEYAERMRDNDIANENINAFNRNPNGLRHCDQYILSGKGEERYHPRFVYHGFRYVKVSGKADVLAIEACVVHTDLSAVGSFVCGNDLINQIHQATVRAILANYHSIPTDCPHREQNGWTADAHVSAEPAMMNFNMEAAYLKWLNDFKDMQRPDGQLPSIVPTPRSGYRAWGGPAWESAVIIIPYEIYRLTGKTKALRQSFGMMDRYLQFLTKMAENYIIGYGLGDWCAPRPEHMCDIHITDTAYFYQDAVIMAKTAKLLGKDARKYHILAEKIKAAFRSRFLDAELLENQTGLAVAAGMGLLTLAEEKRAAERLAQMVRENQNRVDCGILGNKYIYRVLSRNGYGALAFAMITNPCEPSYAFWIQNGMTTLCENWNMRDSLNHHMFSEVDMWFYQFLAGITVEAEKIMIAPLFIDAVGWVRARYRDIQVSWNQTALTVTVPREAEVWIGDEKFFITKGTHMWQRKEFQERK